MKTSNIKLDLKPAMTIKDLKNFIVTAGYDVKKVSLVFGNGKKLLPIVFYTSMYDNVNFQQHSNVLKNSFLNINNHLPDINIRVRKAKGPRGSSIGYPKVEGWENIPAWSRGAKPWKYLSPFEIGPVMYEENGNIISAALFENFWQGWKVWEVVKKQNQKSQKSKWVWPKERHVDINLNPNELWVKWHNAMMKHKTPVRRPNGKNIPLYAYWKGKKLGIVEARKQIYIPYLQYLYRSHPTYKKLLEKVLAGSKIIILEPDGPLYDIYPDGMPVNLELLYNLQNVTKIGDIPGGNTYSNPKQYFPYGHGMVIALTLLEDVYNLFY